MIDIPQTVIEVLRKIIDSGQVDIQDRWQVTKYALFTLQETQAAAWLQQNRASYGEAMRLADEGASVGAN